MNSYNLQEELYQSEGMDVEQRNEPDNWEFERHLLIQQIKELENALNKAKMFHRKFADDVIHSEEIRNQDFDREKRELIAVNKRQIAEIRELTKDKSFYETTCKALMNEKEMNSNTENSSQPLIPAKGSTIKAWKSPARPKSTRNDSKFKISTKLFEDNKKLKAKVSKLTKSNATLRLQVKQLENFKNKIQSRKQQQVVDQQEMHDLLKSTTRTNSQIFNEFVLSHLDELNRMEPQNEN